MRLRNKKTGEIFDYRPTLQRWNGPLVARCNYNSIAELNEEWEDAPEEPVYYYFIQDDGRIGCDAVEPYNHESKVEERKAIGNHFETEEEAELAVRKLKAWKRLKDKGLKASSSEICGDDFVVNFKLTNHTDYIQSIDDFDCIFDFGGEE